MSNNSSEDQILLRKELSGISPYEGNEVIAIKGKPQSSRGKDAILLNAASEHNMKKQVPIADRIQ